MSGFFINLQSIKFQKFHLSFLHKSLRYEFFLNQFSTNVPLLYPLKTSEILMFSGGVEVEHRLKMGQVIVSEYFFFFLLAHTKNQLITHVLSFLCSICYSKVQWNRILDRTIF